MIGYALYNVGGFVLPFTLVGCCSLIIAVCLSIILPSMSDYKQIDDGKTKGKDQLTLRSGLKVKTENKS